MPNVKNIFSASLISMMLVSCGEKKSDTSLPINQEVPKALQEGSLEIKRYTSSRDLTEELYQELVDKTPVLKKLEEDLNALSTRPIDLKDKFNQYDYKSSGYYNSATNKASSISDSLLKNKIIALIKQRQQTYTSKTEELNALLKQMSHNGTTLKDHHAVLKIVMTLPIIEKYQDENKPDKKEFKNVLRDQDNLILKIDSLIPIH